MSKSSKGKPRPDVSDLFCKHMAELGIAVEREVKFFPSRKWKLDFALRLPRQVLRTWAVEMHGSVWTQGRHTRGKGFLADREKINHALAVGWKVLEFSTQQIEDGTAKSFISRELLGRKA